MRRERTSDCVCSIGYQENGRRPERRVESQFEWKKRKRFLIMLERVSKALNIDVNQLRRILIFAGLFIVLACAFSVKWAFDSNNHYYFRDDTHYYPLNGRISFNYTVLFFHFDHVDGDTIDTGKPPYIVLYDNTSFWRGVIIRHENCHVQQLVEKRTPSELECYIKMLEW